MAMIFVAPRLFAITFVNNFKVTWFFNLNKCYQFWCLRIGICFVAPRLFATTFELFQDFLIVHFEYDLLNFVLFPMATLNLSPEPKAFVTPNDCTKFFNILQTFQKYIGYTLVLFFLFSFVWDWLSSFPRRTFPLYWYFGRG